MSKQRETLETARHDAAVAASVVIMEEFFPHCPNGMHGAIQERLCEVIETAITAALASGTASRFLPSQN